MGEKTTEGIKHFLTSQQLLYQFGTTTTPALVQNHRELYEINNSQQRSTSNSWPSFTKKTGNPKPFINTLDTDPSSFYTNHTWIIDSGATDHVSSHPPIANRYNFKYPSVKLSNGGHAEIKFIGSRKLGYDY